MTTHPSDMFKDPEILRLVAVAKAAYAESTRVQLRTDRFNSKGYKEARAEAVRASRELVEAQRAWWEAHK